MKDAGVEWGTRRPIRFRNPAKEQHDDRVIAEIERMLFIPEKHGEAAWRFGHPVRYVTIEVPEPANKRSKKGEQPERHENTFRERLLSETGGVCIYTGKPVDAKSMQIDHIVPRSRNGPDVWDNLVCASGDANNAKEKGKKLPSEWLSGDAWKQFKERVEELYRKGKINDRKKEILLLDTNSENFDSDNPYRDNPTPLARISGTHRMFVDKLQKLFETYKVTVPQQDYRLDKPVIQEVDGVWTQRLRRSWAYSDSEGTIPNFPEKAETDMFNHAQDAAIAASVPPHTWRNKIFVQPVKRKSHDGETKDRIIARLDIAPEWAAFEKRPNRKPLLKIFGVRPTWRTQLFGQTLWTDPMTGDGPRKVYRPIKTIDEDAKQSKSPDKIVEHDKLLKERKEGQLRQKVTRNSGGQAIIILGITGKRPPRKIQVEPGRQSTGCKIRLNQKEKVEIALIRPSALKKFFHGETSPHQDGIFLERDHSIWLPAATKTGKNGTKSYPEGHYYIKEISNKDVIVIHEQHADLERILGKTELKRIFFPDRQ